MFDNWTRDQVENEIERLEHEIEDLIQRKRMLISVAFDMERKDQEQRIS